MQIHTHGLARIAHSAACDLARENNWPIPSFDAVQLRVLNPMAADCGGCNRLIDSIAEALGACVYDRPPAAAEVKKEEKPAPKPKKK